MRVRTERGGATVLGAGTESYQECEGGVLRALPVVGAVIMDANVSLRQPVVLQQFVLQLVRVPLQATAQEALQLAT